jgi:hypothetical protein
MSPTEFIVHLWLPILLSAVAVWFWSFLSWAILPLHKKDWENLPNEDAFGASVRPLNIAPGVYGFPHCADNKQRNDPAFQEKWKAGPVGLLHLWNPNPSMGANMIVTFGVYLVVSCLIAYAGHAAIPHASHAKAMQVVGTMGILAYSFAFLPNMVWFQGGKRAMLTAVFDGLVQGLATGAIFAALWPA